MEPKNIKPYDYQPKKVELEADVRIDTTPEELLKVAFQQIQVPKK